MDRKRIGLTMVATLLLMSCGSGNHKSDAYGNFETNEIIVSAENGGKIVVANFHQGDRVNAGDVLAITDTVQLALQKAQLLAQRNSVAAQRAAVQAQIAIAEQQIVNLGKDKERIDKMVLDGAATLKQQDDIEGQLALVRKQISAHVAQLQAIDRQTEAADASIAVITDKIATSRVISPIDGTILEKYAETGELATPGKPLYKLANLETLLLKVYISGTQLTKIKIGEPVKVLFDAPEGLRELQGMVEWVSSQAEFTPKVIQTREERLKLVYAVKVRVMNDGSLKIGMPGEIRFKD
jgi:HlyD family secretion protein